MLMHFIDTGTQQFLSSEMSSWPHCQWYQWSGIMSAALHMKPQPPCGALPLRYSLQEIVRPYLLCVFASRAACLNRCRLLDASMMSSALACRLYVICDGDKLNWWLSSYVSPASGTWAPIARDLLRSFTCSSIHVAGVCWNCCSLSAGFVASYSESGCTRTSW